MPQVEFYFVRCEGRGEQEKCTGLILLKLLVKPTSKTPSCQVDIKNMCSTETGQGTLLTFKLCSYLTTLPVPTMLHVRVDKCKETAAGFYSNTSHRRNLSHRNLGWNMTPVSLVILETEAAGNRSVLLNN